MNRKLFLRKNQIIQGPFSADQLHQQLQSGRITPYDEVSADKKEFWTIAREFNLITPEHIAEPQEDPCPPQPGSADETDTATPPQESPIDPVTPMVITPDNSIKALLSDTVEMLYNSHGASLKLYRRDGLHLLGAGIMALVLSLLIVALGAGIFAIRYNVPPVVLWVRSLTFALAGGLITYLSNTIIRWLGCDPEGTHPGCGEGDFLAAMGAMLNLAAFYTLSAAVLFLFNTRLYTPDFMKQTVALIVFSLPMLYTLTNAVLALRVHFLLNNNFHTSTSLILAIMEIWAVIAIYSVLVLTVFTA